MPKQHYIRQAAAELRAEASANAREVAAALAPPDDAHDAVKLTRAQVVDLVREQSFIDPDYLAKKLDSMAPRVGDTQLRSPNGVKYFHEVVKEARPDVYAAITGDLRPLQRHQVDAQQEVP